MKVEIIEGWKRDILTKVKIVLIENVDEGWWMAVDTDTGFTYRGFTREEVLEIVKKSGVAL